MGLKILHSADWHLEGSFSGFSPRLREHLKGCQKSIPKRVGELIAREGCDLALLAGDIFDSPHPKKQTVEELKAEFARWEVPVCIAPGNHDYCCPGSPWLEETWPVNVHIFTGGLESIVFPELNCRVYGAGYQSMDCPPLLEGFHAQGVEEYRLLVLHGDLVSHNSPYCPVTVEQMQGSGLDYAALGHNHGWVSRQAGKTGYGCSGTPLGRSWNEARQEGVTVARLGKTRGVLRLGLGLPTLYDNTISVEFDPEETIRDILRRTPGENLYRFSLSGEGSVDTDALLAKFPDVFMELADVTRPPLDIWEGAGEDSLRGLYFRILREKAEEDDTAALAAELSQKLLQGWEVELP